MSIENTTNNEKVQKPLEKQISREEGMLEGEKAPRNEQEPEKEQKPEEGKKLNEEQELEEEPQLAEQQKQKEGFPVVGIGASAGGLGAFEAFFSGIPAKVNPGVAFILIQHLDPKHKSMLTDLIRRYTDLPVYEIEEGMEVKPNCVYIIPPNKDLIYGEDVLHLVELTEPRGRRTSIDFFFRSLAEKKQEKAIGIILSGTGSDGTLGIRAIKSEGGMAMAQSPESSEYDSMPRNVIDAGLADYILPPKDMPAKLTAFITQAFGEMTFSATKTRESMNEIFNQVFSYTGHDFSHYKMGTIKRRMERRMAVQSIKTIHEYARYLEQNSAEVDTLFRDFLISVTNFFRNPKSFDMLQEKVIPKLFVGKPAGETIRIWVAGCSTGEEAYSIGILLQEYMEKLRQTFKILIFATDIDARAIERARAGIYPANIAVDVSKERLERFFSVGPDGNYTINKNIREMVIFSEHDLIRDPPFSKLDLLSCRNVLIYMDRELQNRLIPLFYYALNPGKYLFLGSSETINTFTNLFDMLDRKEKLYQSKQNVGADQLRSIVPFIPSRLESTKIYGTPHEIPTLNKSKYREMTERILLRKYAPAGVLVNEKGDIFYIHGRTGMYLEPAEGDTGVDNILSMAREGLHQRLPIALHKAAGDKMNPLSYQRVQVKTNGDFTYINLEIIPVASTPYAVEGSDLYLIIFEGPPKWEQKKTTETGSKDEISGVSGSGTEVNQHILELMEQLRIKEEELKATDEELQTSTEELKSSNEEMQSINEELQSSNEELESSKEELQSLNEELTTVNTELQNKLSDLYQVNNDMNNLFAGTNIGTIFVDYDMRIMRFTPAVTAMINLIPTDVGRPIQNIVPNIIGYNHLEEDIKEVLYKLTPKEIEVQTRNKNWYLMRIIPYRTLDNIIKGAVITFTDITELRRSRELLRESETSKRLAAIVHDSNDAIILQDLKGSILAWNPSAEKMYGWSEAEALKMNIASLIPEGRRKEELNNIKRLSQAEALEPYHTQRLTKEGQKVDVLLTSSSLLDKENKMYAISTTERRTVK